MGVSGGGEDGFFGKLRRFLGVDGGQLSAVVPVLEGGGKLAKGGGKASGAAAEGSTELELVEGERIIPEGQDVGVHIGEFIPGGVRRAAAPGNADAPDTPAEPLGPFAGFGDPAPGGDLNAGIIGSVSVPGSHQIGEGGAVVNAGDELAFLGGIGKGHGAVSYGIQNGKLCKLGSGEIVGRGDPDQVSGDGDGIGGCGVDRHGSCGNQSGGEKSQPFGWFHGGASFRKSSFEIFSV